MILKRSFSIHIIYYKNKFDWFFTRVIENTLDLKDINNNVVHRVMVIIIFFFTCILPYALHVLLHSIPT